MKKPSVSTIPAGQAFAGKLAGDLMAAYGAQEALSRVLLLLPSRRACLAMREAFLQASGGAPVLLPRLEPLGDVDADLWMSAALYAGSAEEAATIPPVMPRAARVMKLAKLVHAFEKQGREGTKVAATMEHAVLLAEALAALLDECARERVPIDRLRQLVEIEEFARHWEISLRFLEIVLSYWPAVERQEGQVSAAARQDALLTRLASHWKEHPPEHPVIVAGTTGSIPATAELLAVIARLPQGEVVLPGLDVAMEEEVWRIIEPTHPQFVLKELLQRLGVERHEVAVRGEDAHPARTALLREVMLPPDATDRWASLDMKKIEAGFSGMACVACDSQEQEAAAISLKLREVMESPHKTAMLVTPDRGLAKRVSRMLGRYGVAVDDSSGLRLPELTPAVFLRLVIECAASDGAPVALLSLLRHPFCALEEGAEELRRYSREIERCLLRGIRPPGGMAGMLETAQRHEHLSQGAKKLLQKVAEVLAPLLQALRLRQGKEVPFTQMLALHVRAAEALAGEGKLWAGHPGQKLSAAIAEIGCHATALGDIDPASYAGIMENLLGAVMYQPPYGGHPRLAIMSPMEARMQQADVVILGGLNEESWPAPAIADPWMNNTMRQAMGLPPAERAIGQSAHDIWMLAATAEVMITRARKRGNAPAIPSRWWLRLEAVAGREALEHSGRQWAIWGKALFSGDQTMPLLEPKVSPPLTARPTELWVTQVENLMRDPYRFYVSHILALRPLEALDAELAASDFGKVVHDTLEHFAQQYGENLPTNAQEKLEAIGKEKLMRHFHHTQAEAFWLPRLRRIAAWYVMEEETRRRNGLSRVIPEQVVSRSLEEAGRVYRLQARVDRREIYKDDTQIIIDYKTGQPPNLRDVKSGVACQLLLEAWMMSEKVPASHVGTPEYWKLTGSREAGRVTPLFGKSEKEKTTGQEMHHLRETEEGLRRLLNYFSQADALYLIAPDPEIMPAYNEYEHIERRSEWSM